ncbi:hypothetical protein JOQ06_020738, partial [Pogonophryne albipinna]
PWLEKKQSLRIKGGSALVLRAKSLSVSLPIVALNYCMKEERTGSITQLHTEHFSWEELLHQVQRRFKLHRSSST